MARSFVWTLLLLALSATACGGSGAPPPFQPGPGPDPDPDPVPDPPTVTSVSPASGLVGGGTPVTITGTGFATEEAGANTVTFGGSAATGVATVNDTTIACDVPAGVTGTVDVSVANAHGTGTLVGGFTYVEPLGPTLFAADGKGGTPGLLYRVDPATAETTAVGPIGFAVTGMAFTPAGTLYAVEATLGGAQRLLRIDPATGAGQVAGTLARASGGALPGPFADIEFVAPLHILAGLFGSGRTASTPGFGIIDTDTALVTLGTEGTSGVGNAIAAGITEQLVAAPQGYAGPFVFVDPHTGAMLPLGNPSGGARDALNAMTSFQGTFYANDASRGGASTLVTVDPTSGTITAVGALPAGVDALASNVR
jgi:hypothetical protein